jgi:hypothetical protein
MSNELISLPPDETDLSTITTGAYLGRVKFCQASSEEVKSGVVPRGGHFVFETDSGVIDLGPAMQCLPLGGRAKAIDYSGEDVVVNFDPTSDTFQKIAMNCKYGSRKMAGPEHLLYLPTVKEFAYLYCYNKTLKEVSAKVQAGKGKAIELESYFYKGARDSWHKIKVEDCAAFPIPDAAAIQRAIEAFRAEEKGAGVEEAPADSRER